MASKSGHLATGAASGVLAAVLLSKLNTNIQGYVLFLTFLAAIPGGTAPDWLEIASWSPETGRTSVIKHRTITHWGIAWLILLMVSLFLSPVVIWMPILFGFAAGGVTHLLVDWPNPMGVPWIRIKKRHSLKLWRSGENEFAITIVVWTLTSYVAYMAWYYPYFGTKWPWQLNPVETQSILDNLSMLFKSAYYKWK